MPLSTVSSSRLAKLGFWKFTVAHSLCNQVEINVAETRVSTGKRGNQPVRDADGDDDKGVQ